MHSHWEAYMAMAMEITKLSLIAIESAIIIEYSCSMLFQNLKKSSYHSLGKIHERKLNKFDHLFLFQCGIC